MLGDNIKRLMFERELSIQELADMAGIPFETLRNIYYNKVRDPKVSTVYQISRVLGVSVNTLLGDGEFSAEESELVELYNGCGNHGKGLISLVAKYEYKMAMRERSSDTLYRIPCLIPVGRITDGIPGNGNEVIEIFTDNETAYMAIQISTNNFSPVFCKGDRILLENRFPENGERAVFEFKGKLYFRQYIEMAGKINLKSMNRIGEDIVIKRADEVECVGTYIGITNL